LLSTLISSEIDAATKRVFISDQFNQTWLIIPKADVNKCTVERVEEDGAKLKCFRTDSLAEMK
jgi:hypothetical protein